MPYSTRAPCNVVSAGLDAGQPVSECRWMLMAGTWGWALLQPSHAHPVSLRYQATPIEFHDLAEQAALGDTVTQTIAEADKAAEQVDVRLMTDLLDDVGKTQWSADSETSAHPEVHDRQPAEDGNASVRPATLTDAEHAGMNCLSFTEQRPWGAAAAAARFASHDPAAYVIHVPGRSGL